MSVAEKTGGSALAQSEVREVLQYVPLFSGRTFLVALSGAEMSDMILAETLLDLRALQKIGVKLVILYAGETNGVFMDLAAEVELKVSTVTDNEALAVLNRGQAALIIKPGALSFNQSLVETAHTVQPDKILYLEEERSYPASWQGALSLEEVQRSMEQGGSTSELSLWITEALSGGVQRVHFLKAEMPGCLSRELFSNEGVGVMIYRDSYQGIRPLSEEDIPEFLAIIGRSIRAKHLIPRSYEEVMAQLGDYYVMTIDDNVVGCVALHAYENGVCELACLFVKPAHKGLGYGRDLVEFAEERAKEEGYEKIIALSTEAGGFFQQQMGYEEISLEEIPQIRYEKLMKTGRNSVALQKDLR